MKELYKFCQAGLVCMALLLMSSHLFSQYRSLTAYPSVQIDPLIGGFYVSLPPNYKSGPKGYPLLVMLHGAGEIADGSARTLPPLLNTGPLKQINLQVNKGQLANFRDPVVVNGKSYNFIVVAPEFNAWPQAGGEQRAVNAMIDYAIQHFRVDTTKIYLTGLSMGGGITWEYAGTEGSTCAKRLAAILVVAGASIPNAQRGAAMAAAHLPVWATHNAIDSSVPNTFTFGYIQAMKDAGANPAPIMTIFNRSGHGGWPETYGDVNVPPCVNGQGLTPYQWMLQYRRVGDSIINESDSVTPSSIFTVDAGANITTPFPVVPHDSIPITAITNIQNDEIATTRWTQVMGPANPRSTITHSDSTTAFMSGLQAGLYAFQVTLTSKSGKTVSSQMLLTVNPLPDQTFLAYAGPDGNITLPTDSFLLKGKITLKGMGLASHKWWQVSGPATAAIAGGGSITPTVKNLIAGTYVFELDITSTTGKTASSQVKVVVNGLPGGPGGPGGPGSPGGPGDTTQPTPPTSTGDSIKLYPNPVLIGQQFIVEGKGWKKGTLKFLIYDRVGRLARQIILENTADTFIQTVPVAGLSQGSYILRIIMDGEKSKSYKFFVQ